MKEELEEPLDIDDQGSDFDDPKDYKLESGASDSEASNRGDDKVDEGINYGDKVERPTETIPVGKMKPNLDRVTATILDPTAGETFPPSEALPGIRGGSVIFHDGRGYYYTPDRILKKKR